MKTKKIVRSTRKKRLKIHLSKQVDLQSSCNITQFFNLVSILNSSPLQPQQTPKPTKKSLSLAKPVMLNFELYSKENRNVWQK